MSQLKIAFKQSRTPTPIASLSLFPTSSCSIEDKDEFFENAKRNMIDIIYVEHLNSKFMDMRYVIFQLYQCLEKQIQSLQESKTSYPIQTKRFSTLEKHTISILTLLNRYIDAMTKIKGLTFSYFDQLLEFADNRLILRNLVLLGIQLLMKKEEIGDSLGSLCSLYSFSVPFLKLFYHFNWDLSLLKNKLGEILDSRKDESTIPDTIKDLFLNILDNGNDIIRIIQENSLHEVKDKTHFVTSLSAKLLEHSKTSKEANSQKYFKALGEIELAFSLLHGDLGLTFIADVCLIHNLQGFLKFTVQEGFASAELLNLNIEPCHLRFRYCLTPSAVGILVEKVRELAQKQDLPLENLTKEIEEISLYLSSLWRNLELCDLNCAKETLEQIEKQVQEVLRKLFCVDIESLDKENRSKPPILEIWETITKLYKRCFSSYTDESYNVFGDLSDSPKDKVNILMYNLTLLLRLAVPDLTETITNEDQKEVAVFMEQYYNTANEIISEMVSAVTLYDLQSNYISLIVYKVISKLFEDLSNSRAFDYFDIPLTVIRKLESFVQFTYSPAFDELFNNSPDAALLQKIISAFLDYDVLFHYENETIENASKRNYMTHMSTFNIIDFILENNSTCTNELARKAQDEIIRFYTLFHLNSQLLAVNAEEGDQIVYYSFERIKQVWQIILSHFDNYSYFMLEITNTQKIVYYILDANQQFPRYYKALDHLAFDVLFSKAFFNLDVDYLMENEETKQTVFSMLLSLKSHNITHFKSVVETICASMKNNFEALLKEAGQLQLLFEQNDPGFTKAFLVAEQRTSDLFKRIIRILEIMMLEGESKSLPNDSLKADSQAIYEMLENYLPLMMTSPIFFMIGNETSFQLTQHLRTLNLAGAIFAKAFPIYASQLPGIITIVKEELQKESGMSPTLQRKLLFLSAKHENLGLFFSDSYSDDLRDLYKINSILFFMAYFNFVGMQLLVFGGFALFQDSGEAVEATPLTAVLPQITKNIVIISSIITKRALVSPEDAKFKGFIVINELHMQNYGYWSTSTTEYFKTKIKLLVDLMTTFDETQNEEDKFCVRMGCLLCLLDLNERIHNEKLFSLYGNLEAVLKVLEVCFTMLFKLFETVSHHFINNDTAFVSDVQIRIKEDSSQYKTVKMLAGLYRIVEIAVSSHFSDIWKMMGRLSQDCSNIQMDYVLDNRVKESFFTKVHDMLDTYLEKIGSHLLSLKLLNVPEYNYCPLSLIMNKIGDCYLSFFQSIGGVVLEKNTTENSEKMDIENKMQGSGGGGQDTIDDTWVKMLQEKSKLILFKFLTKLTSFVQAPYARPYFHTFCKDTLNDFFNKYRLFLLEGKESGLDGSMEEEKMVIAQIYRNPVINKLRNIYPILLLLSQNDDQMQETDKDLTWKILVETLEKIKYEDLMQENLLFVEKDLLEILKEITYSAAVLAQNFIIKALNEGLEGPCATNMENTIEAFMVCLRKSIELVGTFEGFKSKFGELFRDKKVLYVLYAALQMKEFDQIASENKLLDTLIKNTKKKFYILAEIYALNAYDPEKILTLKLKSLVHLDKTGSRIFQSRSIKNLEPYYNDLLTKIWKENFTVEKDNNSGNLHSDRVVVIKEKQDMKGKVDLYVEGQNITVSSLSFLKNGMNLSTRKVLQRLMENIACTTREHMRELIQGQDDQDVLREIVDSVESQLGVLSGLVKNYPELAVFVNSYELEENHEVPHDFLDILPQFERKQTFLGFLIKFCCYLYNFKASVLLEELIYRNNSPIFIEYEGKPVLLSSYNRIFVFQELLKVFEDTLNPPEKFLKTIYTRATWSILGQITASLSCIPGEGNHEDFELEAISSVTSLYMKALKTYYDHRSEERNYGEETQVLYYFLIGLVESDVTIRTKRLLIPKEGKITKILKPEDDFPWLWQIYKEETYTKNKLCSFSEELIPQTLTHIDTANFSHDEKIMQYYCFKYKGFDKAVLSNLLKYLNSADGFYSGLPQQERDWIKNPAEIIQEMQTNIRTLDPRINPYKKDPEYIKVAKLFYEFITFTRSHPLLILTHENKEDIKPTIIMFVRNEPAPLERKFRKLVKKALGWRIAKKKQSQNIPEMLAKNQEDFSTLIKKIGLKEISKMIQTNKKRIKTLVRNQQEKFLVSKLETMVNQQVNIDYMLSLETDVDNLKFFSQQNEFDKKLILLLANKDFIQTLGHEIKQQSEAVRKALVEEEKRQKEQEAVDEDFEIEEESGSGNNQQRIKRKKTEEEDEKKADKNKPKIKENKQGDEYEEDDEAEEVSEFSEEDVQDGDNNDNDGDYEDAPENGREDAGESKDTANEETIKLSKQKKKVKKASKPKTNEEIEPVEDVSSACHTKDYSDDEIEEDDKEEDDEDNSEVQDPDSIKVKANYNVPILSYVKSFYSNEVIGYGILMSHLQKIEKKLTYLDVLPFSMKPIAPASKAACEEWVNQVLFLCLRTGKRQDKPTYMLNTFKRFFDFLIKVFLDPIKEQTILPLLALYIAGYSFKSVKPHPEDAGGDDILFILREYAIRSPSSFFRPFNIDDFDAFIEKNKSNENEGWLFPNNLTICDLLFMVYIQRDFGNKRSIDEHQDLGQFISFLLHLRYEAKEDMLPTYIKELRQKNVTVPSQVPSTTHLMDLSQNCEDFFKYNDDINSNNFFFVFKFLSFTPSYQKSVLSVCHNLLAYQSEKEKNNLTRLKNKINQILQIPGKISSEEKNYLLTAIVDMYLHTPLILRLLSDVLKRINVNDSELTNFLLESEVLSSEVKDLAICFVEVLELIARANEKQYLEGATRIREKLQDMLEVPVHYHVYLSKVREITQAKTLINVQDRKNHPVLIRMPSNQGLLRLSTMDIENMNKNKDVSNIQNFFVSWINRNREFINSVINYGSEHDRLNLWFVKKFSWALDFNLKERILREALSTRDEEEKVDILEEDCEISKEN